MDIITSPILKWDWLHSLQLKMDKLCTVSKTRPGAQCGSDRDLFITKFRLKLKKVGKTTRPFRYDLNHQIPYHYTVKGTNRFKGSDLVDRVPGELWTNQVHNVGQEVVTKIIRKTKKGKKAKRQNGCLRNTYKQLRKEEMWEEEKYTPLNAEFQSTVRRDKTAFLNEKWKERGKQQNEKD